MTKKTKIVLGISAATLLVLILAAVDLFFFEDLRQWFWMEIHDESHLASCLVNIEDNSVVEFPEKIESLKAAERVYTEREGSYVFVLRFKTDKKGLAQLRESLSQLDEYREYSVEPDDRTDDSDLRILFKNEHTPEWYNEELPEGVFYTSYGKGVDYYLESRKGKLIHMTCTWIVLAESEEVLVYMAGDCFYSMKDYGD
jgi:hypothetical protein